MIRVFERFKLNLRMSCPVANGYASVLRLQRRANLEGQMWSLAIHYINLLLALLSVISKIYGRKQGYCPGFHPKLSTRSSVYYTHNVSIS